MCKLETLLFPLTENKRREEPGQESLFPSGALSRDEFPASLAMPSTS
jgi:hypothetical protein